MKQSFFTSPEKNFSKKPILRLNIFKKIFSIISNFKENWSSTKSLAFVFDILAIMIIVTSPLVKSLNFSIDIVGNSRNDRPFVDVTIKPITMSNKNCSVVILINYVFFYKNSTYKVCYCFRVFVVISSDPY